MAQTVIGLFQNESDAQRAAQALEQIGISRDMVDISRGSGDSSMNGGSMTGGTSTTGSSTTGTGLSDLTDGNRDNSGNGVTRFFKSLFGDDNDEADRYSRMGNSGGYSVVTVHVQNAGDAERAADILDEYGAVNVDESSAQYAGTQQGMNTDRQNVSADSDTTISRVQEELQVGKREVEKGSVRVRSRIVEKPVEESIRLREEHVRVDRQAVNRPLSNSDLTAFQDQDIELTERTEVPVVNKEARVVEEIRISKDVDERTETIRDTVRNTEVDIDIVGGTDLDNLNSGQTNRNQI